MESKSAILMRQYLEAGVSKSATARLVGVSRRTLYNWIEAGELERDPDDTVLQYGPRHRRPSKIDPYRVYFGRRLSDYPQPTAARLFREIHEEGCPGGYGQVKHYVRLKKDEIVEVKRAGPNGRKTD